MQFWCILCSILQLFQYCIQKHNKCMAQTGVSPPGLLFRLFRDIELVSLSQLPRLHATSCIQTHTRWLSHSQRVAVHHQTYLFSLVRLQTLSLYSCFHSSLSTVAADIISNLNLMPSSSQCTWVTCKQLHQQPWHTTCKPSHPQINLETLHINNAVECAPYIALMELMANPVQCPFHYISFQL